MNNDALTGWLDAYGDAWRQRDADAVIRLFTADALYYETPYAEPFNGRDGIAAYWRRVTSDQRDIDFSSDALGVIGDTGVARWSARFTAISTGAGLELNGVFLLEFDEQGLCACLREWWHLK
jgi:ketosteroid isomerase-like protein